jgi:hypothetical protein
VNLPPLKLSRLKIYLPRRRLQPLRKRKNILKKKVNRVYSKNFSLSSLIKMSKLKQQNALPLNSDKMTVVLDTCHDVNLAVAINNIVDVEREAEDTPDSDLINVINVLDHQETVSNKSHVVNANIAKHININIIIVNATLNNRVKRKINNVKLVIKV